MTVGEIFHLVYLIVGEFHHRQFGMRDPDAVFVKAYVEIRQEGRYQKKKPDGDKDQPGQNFAVDYQQDSKIERQVKAKPVDSGSIASDTASIVTGPKFDHLSNFVPVTIYTHIETRQIDPHSLYL